MSDYTELLKDPRWQKMRLKVLERDDFSCQICYNPEETLHVHHRFYIRGRKPWEYDVSNLVTLCATCHKEESDNLSKEIDLLSKNVKELFFSHDIKRIADSIPGSKLVMPSEVIASIIESFFKDSEFQKIVVDEFFSHIAKKHEKEG